MWIWDLIKRVWGRIKNFFKRIINGILNFYRDIRAWFEKLSLKLGNHIPVLAKTNSDLFKQVLHEAPVKNVGIFQCVYDQEADEITNGEYIQADSLDTRTHLLLEHEDVIIFS